MKVPASRMTDKEIASELGRLGKEWDAFRSDDDDGHGGSPGEWMVERMGELETEQKRRQSQCRKCGSKGAKRDASGSCVNANGCRARRCAERVAQDRKRAPNGRQCFATIGQTSIRFCMMREGHDEPHVNGMVEWVGVESHPVAAAIRRGLK